MQNICNDVVLYEILSKLSPMDIINSIEAGIYNPGITDCDDYWRNRLYSDIPIVSRISTLDDFRLIFNVDFNKWYEVYRYLHVMGYNTINSIIGDGLRTRNFFLYYFGVESLILSGGNYRIGYIDYVAFNNRIFGLANNLGLAVDVRSLELALYDRDEYELLAMLYIYFGETYYINNFIKDVGYNVYLNDRDLFFSLITSIDIRHVKSILTKEFLDKITPEDLDILISIYPGEEIKNVIKHNVVRSENLTNLLKVLVNHYGAEDIAKLLIYHNMADIVNSRGDLFPA